MSKTMATLSKDIVKNITNCISNEPESVYKKDTGGRDVNIGDTYSDGQFYHNGERILTELEIAQSEIEKLMAEKAQLETAYQEGVNSI